MTGRQYRNRSNSTASAMSHSSAVSNGTNGKNNHARPRSNSHSYHGRPRSNSHSSHLSGHSTHHHNHHPRKPQSKKDLWKGSIDKPIGDNVVVQLVGMDSKRDDHTCYARVDPSCPATPLALAKVPIGKVIAIMVDEGWRHVAKDILEKGVHVETADSYPSAAELLALGAVWLLNETAYAAGENAHAKRLSPKDEDATPDWKDMTLRVHYVPDRFFVAHEVDWSKYCRGLLLDDCTGASVGGRKALVPMDKLPDGKDGVIVYENDEIGFAVLNKPGGMPCHSTLSNHAEDVGSMFGAALKERHAHDETKHFLSLPLRVEPEMHGLVLAATKKEFCSYMTKQLENTSKNAAAKPIAEPLASNASESISSSVHSGQSVAVGGVTKTYRTLVCIKDPSDIDRIEKLMGKVLEHYVDVRSPTPKKFVRNKPKSSHHEWQPCRLRIVGLGQSTNFRAACVSSRYSDSNDFTLAHRLWGPNMEHPAEDLGVNYVMQLDVQLLTRSPHQIRGQLAALGVPIVGDVPYGGGACEMRQHRHMWTRMAVQVCHLEFDLPRWEEEEKCVEGGDADESGEGEKKEEEEKKPRHLVPSNGEEGDRCVFHLNTCWWSEYLVDYERHSPSCLIQQEEGAEETILE